MSDRLAARSSSLGNAAVCATARGNGGCAVCPAPSRSRHGRDDGTSEIEIDVDLGADWDRVEAAARVLDRRDRSWRDLLDRRLHRRRAGSRRTDLRASFVAAVGGSTAIPSSIVTHAPRERRADRDRDGLSRHTKVCIDGASIRAYGSRARLHKGCHFTNHRSIFRLDFQPRLFAGVGADDYSGAIANGRCISEHRRFRLSVHDVTGNDRWYPLTVWFGCGVGSPYARTGWRTS